MEVVTGQLDGIDLRVGDRHALRIEIVVYTTGNAQSGLGGVAADQVYDHLMVDQWLAARGLGDEVEQPMLDTVPLAGAGRQMRHGDRNADLIGQLL